MSAAEQSDDGAKISEQVVALLNEAQTKTDGKEKLKCLLKVQELIIHQGPYLLDNFLDEMLGFMNDPLMDVRKFVLGFIEQASKKDDETVVKVLPNVAYLFQSDTNVNVQKRVITTAAHLYPILIQYCVKTKTPAVAKTTFESFWALKTQILALLDHDNDGVRTHTIKFYETCILVQSLQTETSERLAGTDVHLGTVPKSADNAPDKVLSYKQLESDGKTLMSRLLDAQASAHISAVNLMTCMQCVQRIARCRPIFVTDVISAFEALHANLPPTLAPSQVSSVRKSLKMHLLALLAHPDSADMYATITTLLTDLGATQAQVMKALPAGVAPPPPAYTDGAGGERGKRRKISARVETGSGDATKKARGGDDDDDDDEDFDKPSTSAESGDMRQIAISTTASFLQDRLSVQTVADLVLLSMVALPDDMPPAFQSTYTPIAAAGTESQIEHVARLMATQLTAAGVGPGFEQMRMEETRRAMERAAKDMKTSALRAVMESVRTGERPRLDTANKPDPVPVVDSTPVYGSASSASNRQQTRRLQQLGLAHITRPMEPDVQQRMQLNAALRILNGERRAVQGGAGGARHRMLVRLASRLRVHTFDEHLRAHILNEQKTRGDLALLWMQEMFVVYQTTPLSDTAASADAFAAYDSCLCKLLNALYQKGEHKETLFHKLLLEAPAVTPNALVILKQACMDAVYYRFAMETLKEMITSRPRQRAELISVLLAFACCERADLRNAALDVSRELYAKPHCRRELKEFVLVHAAYLATDAQPPQVLFGADMGRPETKSEWDESLVKACVCLLLHLAPTDASLMLALADIYARAPMIVKRTLLKLVEVPVKVISGDARQYRELLTVIELCPVGAETLATRIVHLLTERNPPTTDLVRRVYELYQTRLTDVRCLVPVLSGLSKSDIASAMPKFIRLASNSLKEVFNRLLNTRGESGRPALTPLELGVLLHELPVTSGEDAQYVANGELGVLFLSTFLNACPEAGHFFSSPSQSMIAAMSTLLSLPNAYTKETISGLIQQLVDGGTNEALPPPVTLRTVLLAVQKYDTLKGFVVNILQRLVAKKLWTNTQLWDDYIACCAHCLPLTIPLVTQLPPAVLSTHLTRTDAGKILRLAVLRHLQTTLGTTANNSIMQALSDPVAVDGGDADQGADSGHRTRVRSPSPVAKEDDDDEPGKMETQ